MGSPKLDPRQQQQDNSRHSCADGNLVTYVTGHYNNMLANRSDVGDPGAFVAVDILRWSNELWKADPPGKQCNQPAPIRELPHTKCGIQGRTWIHNLILRRLADEELFGLFAITPVDPRNRVPVVKGRVRGHGIRYTTDRILRIRWTELDQRRALFKAV